jgi:branched-chain amino acid transport system ATP-binding protein
VAFPTWDEGQQVESTDQAENDCAARRLSSPVFSVEGISVRYSNGAVGVHDVSVTGGRGELVVVFGANGAGKTTTVRALSGFLKTERTRVVSGRVVLNGEDVTNSEPHHQVRRGLFFVQERSNIFPNLSVADNLLALGRPPTRRRRAELMTTISDLFPMIHDRRHEQAGLLSGGQRQMLAISRAILADPRLLVVDELTLGLHHSLQAPLFEAVRHLADRGVCVVLVDESAGYALEVADYCYVLSGGHVYDEGTPSRFHDSATLVAGYVG